MTNPEEGSKRADDRCAREGCGHAKMATVHDLRAEGSHPFIPAPHGVEPEPEEKRLRDEHIRLETIYRAGQAADEEQFAAIEAEVRAEVEAEPPIKPMAPTQVAVRKAKGGPLSTDGWRERIAYQLAAAPPSTGERGECEEHGEQPWHEDGCQAPTGRRFPLCGKPLRPSPEVEPERWHIKLKRWPAGRGVEQSVTGPDTDWIEVVPASALAKAEAALAQARERADYWKGRWDAACEREDKHGMDMISCSVRTMKAEERERGLREALKRSAERLHGLSDDPEHCRHTFEECPHYTCVEARSALQASSPSPTGETE